MLKDKSHIYYKDDEMIKEIDISNFKSIKNIKLGNLKRVNFIAGKNGRGKTSILDAIFITNDLTSPDCLVKPIIFRGGTPNLAAGELWHSYFRNHIKENKIKILINEYNGAKQETIISIEEKAKGNQNIGLVTSDSLDKNNISPTSFRGSESLKIRKYDKTKNEASSLRIDITQQINGSQISSNVINHGGSLELKPTTYITTSNLINNSNTILVVGNLIRNKDQAEIIKEMKRINNKITDIQIGIIENTTEIIFDTGEKKLVSLASMGEGTGKLLTLLAISYNTKNGIILIDEIENGIHYSLMPSIIKILKEQSIKNNNQIFITTHSLDIINTISNLYADKEISDEDISFIRIGYSETKDETLTSSFSLPEVKLSSDENWEIR